MTKLVLNYDRSPANKAELDADRRVINNAIRLFDGIKFGYASMFSEPERDANSTPTSNLLRDYVHGVYPSTEIILDAKLDDIGNTIEAAIMSLTKKVRSVTLHASIKPSALTRAVRASEQAGKEKGVRPLFLFGVSVLTDFDDADCLTVFGKPVKGKVLDFAKALVDAGVPGIVCSGQELDLLGDAGLLTHLTTFVQGIRPDWFSRAGDDQARAITPREAVRKGANLIGVGRPIWNGPYPAAKAAQLIQQEMKAAR